MMVNGWVSGRVEWLRKLAKPVTVATGMHADDVVMLVFTEKLKNTNTGNEELAEILDA